MFTRSKLIPAVLFAAVAIAGLGQSANAQTDPLPEAQYRVLEWHELVPEDWEPPVIAKGHDQALTTSVEPAAVVAELDQQLVALPGFMKPVVFTEDTVSEFILVPMLPHHTKQHAHLDSNQMVYVILLEPLQVANPLSPIWVVGTLGVHSVVTDEGPTAYRIADAVTTEYEY